MTGLKRKPFDIIAFDADDTLWHNETLYTSTKDRFFQLLAKYHSPETIASQLEKTELRNLDHFGYGIKGFTLSMIETAIEMTGGRILGSDIQKIIDFAREMLSANIQLFEHVQDTIPSLAQEYPLMLITKGDLFDQETKIARSGIGGYFTHVEIVSHKTKESYAAILAKHQVEPSRFLMVGNSLRSDILPVIEAGGQAVYIPYALTWSHENDVDLEKFGQGYLELEHVGQLSELIRKIADQRNH